MVLPVWSLVLVLDDPTLLSHGHTLLLGVIVDLHLITHLDVLVLSLLELTLALTVQLVLGFVLEIDTAIFGHLVFLDNDGAVWLALDFHAAVGGGVDDAGLLGEFISTIFLFVGDLVGFGLLGWEFGRGRGLRVPVIELLARV